MAKICFFIAYALTPDAELQAIIKETAIRIAEDGHELIMGGMSGGNMELAGKTYLAAGGKAATIIYPEEFVAQEESNDHPNLTHVRTAGLSERLGAMIATSDAFITFPGGFGTIHELAQVNADNQACTYHIGTTRKVKPHVVFNYDNYYEGLIMQYNRAHADGNIRLDHMNLLQFVDNPEDIFPLLEESLLEAA